MSKRTDRDGFYRQPNSPSYYTRIDGKRVSTGCTTLAAAKAWKAQHIGAVVKTTGAVPFPDVLKRYLTDTSHRRSTRTKTSTTGAIRGLSEHWLDIDLASITAGQLSGYIQARRDTGYADATIKFELGVLRAAIRHWNNLPNVRPISTSAFAASFDLRPASRLRWLTKDEATLLFKHFEPGQMRAASQLILQTGLRSSEVVSLTWDRINMTEGFIEFRHAIPTSQGGQKNRKASQHPIGPPAVRILESLRNDTRYVFPSPRYADRSAGRCMIPNAVTKAATAAGLSDIRAHDLRRTYGSWLLQSGVPIKTVSELLRHSSVVTTERIYAFLTDANRRDALEVLPEIGVIP